MAILRSPDWSLACINSGRLAHKPIFHSSSKTLQFLSLASSNCGVIITNSACPSPILEDASTDQSVVKLDPKIQDYQHFRVPNSEDNLNGFICTLSEDPETEELAYHYYEKAKQKLDFRPEKSTLKHLIRYLIKSKNWSSILSLSQDFKGFHLLPDGSTCCKLISSCIRVRKFRLVNTLLEVFESDHEIAGLAFDSAMRGYNKLHMYSSTVVVYERMRISEIAMEPVCYCQIMEAYLKLGDSDGVLQLFLEFQSRTKMGSISTPFYTKIYRILCESLGRSGRAFEALEYFRQMKEKGIPGDHLIYNSLICSFASIREVQVAEELFKEAESKRMLRNPGLFLKLVLMYIEEGFMETTLEIVAAMKRVKIRVSDCIFCAIVNGFSRRRGLRAAAKVYEELISLQGCEPGQVTYASIINVYCRLGLHSEAESVFSEMEEKGFDKCVVAYSNMVAMYGKTGKQRDAMRLVAKMKERGCEPNVWIYNSLLDMHGRVLNLRQVEKTWKEMKRRKVAPDKVSYTSIISAYSKARELDICVKYYHEFRMNGGAIDRAMAGIMVGVFSKTSRIDELLKLLQDMKSEGARLDGRLYRSALNALRDAGMQMEVKWFHESFHAT